MSKAGVTGAADKALLGQLSGYPKALGMSAAVMLVMALLPGIPMIPFFALGGGAAALAYLIDRRAQAGRRRRGQEGRNRQGARRPRSRSSPSLKMDDLKIELGYALLPLVNAPNGSDRLTEQIKALRRSLAIEMGFVMPSVRILDNVQLDANTYVIKIKEVEAGTGKVWHGQYMVMDPAGKQVTLPGTHTTEPTFGLPATWIDAALKEEASVKGLHRGRRRDRARHAPDRADQGQYVGAVVLRRSAETDQGTAEGAERADQGHRAGADHRFRHPARAANPAGRASVDPRSVDHSRRHRRRAAGDAQSTMLAEHVRARLARQLCAQHVSPAGTLPIIALTAKWEQAFAELIVGQGDDSSLAMQPSKLTEFINLVREKFEQAARDGEAPVLVTSPAIRPFVRGIVERFRAQTTVLAQSEIHPRARLKTVGES